ncbi:MAG: acetyl-CoA carboxylase biotin carboxyl carrier protein [Cyanobacteria bacterium]|nr:acetyl-CoA carboxylase biotin carboxyl carrier protein [Cyanobacteriota bacterium]MDA1021271.1 acetyl-CoA carboxylase biotin carboxyl carrier protein [Cyanobacteriota bacterium]
MAKDELPIDKINKLSEILKDQGLTEIEIESDGLKIKVRKDAQPLTIAAPTAAGPASSTPAKAVNKYIEIKSPMVGTFYSSASPDSEAFVKVGDKVNKGDTICIVEAMKLMNELPAEVEGTVKEICVQNAEAISYGQVIMRLEA